MTPTIPLEDQVWFWSEVFGTPSHNDECTTEPQGRVMWDLVKPIRLEEILATLQKSKDGAAEIIIIIIIIKLYCHIQRVKVT